MCVCVFGTAHTRTLEDLVRQRTSSKRKHSSKRTRSLAYLSRTREDLVRQRNLCIIMCVLYCNMCVLLCCVDIAATAILSVCVCVCVFVCFGLGGV
jgi:hypothetical protein